MNEITGLSASRAPALAWAGARTGSAAGGDGPDRREPVGDRPLDEQLSSTTPDVPKRQRMLPIPATLAWGAGIGGVVGALLLRGRGAGWSLGALASGGWKGALVGAGMGGALLATDRLTGGEVKRQLDYVALDRRAQIGFVLRHPLTPWLAGTGLGVARDARAAQEQLYGRAEPLDGPQDAFRHAYAAALFTLRGIRDHGADPERAAKLAVEAGEAHEVDGQDNNDDFSREMDRFNNVVGAGLVGDGRARSGEQADERGFVTEHDLRRRVFAAIRAGEVQLVDRSTDPPTPRVSTRSADRSYRFALHKRSASASSSSLSVCCTV